MTVVDDDFPRRRHALSAAAIFFLVGSVSGETASYSAAKPVAYYSAAAAASDAVDVLAVDRSYAPHLGSSLVPSIRNAIVDSRERRRRRRNDSPTSTATSTMVVDVDASSSWLGDDGIVDLVNALLRLEWTEGEEEDGIEKSAGGRDDALAVNVARLSVRSDKITASGVAAAIDALRLAGNVTASSPEEGDKSAAKAVEKKEEGADTTAAAIEDDSSASSSPNATCIDASCPAKSPSMPPVLHLDEVDFGFNDLSGGSGNGNRAFLRSLRRLIEQGGPTCPRVLRFDRCCLGPAACRAIGKGIVNRATLAAKVKNQEGDDTSSNVAAATAGSTTQRRHGLTSLYLSGNDAIGDAGAAALAAALKSAPRLRTTVEVEPVLDVLDLSSCDVGDAGAEALALALSSNPGCVRRIDLSNNRISDGGAEALGRSLLEAQRRRRQRKRRRSQPRQRREGERDNNGEGDGGELTGDSSEEELELSFLMDGLNIDNNAGVGDRGAASIASAAGSGALRESSLRSCAIGANGAAAFGEAMASAKMGGKGGAGLQIDLSGNCLGVLRPKKKGGGAAYSAGLLKSKASATTKSYVNFVGKKIQSGLKDAGLDVSAFMGNLSPTAESDDDEEALMGMSPESDALPGASKTSAPRCGARSFTDAILKASLNKRDIVEFPSSDDKGEKGCLVGCRLAMRHSSLDQGAADALAASVLRARDMLGIDLSIDASMNSAVDERAVLALRTGADMGHLSVMAKRHLDAMEALRLARERAAEAAEAAAARAKAEAAFMDAFDRDSGYSDLGDVTDEESHDFEVDDNYDAY